MLNLKPRQLANVGTVSGFLCGYQAILGIYLVNVNHEPFHYQLLSYFLLALSIGSFVAAVLIGKDIQFGIHLGIGVWTADLVMRIIFLIVGVASVNLLFVFATLLNILLIFSLSSYMSKVAGVPKNVAASNWRRHAARARAFVSGKQSETGVEGKHKEIEQGFGAAN